jgi:hypothetical protein
MPLFIQSIKTLRTNNSGFVGPFQVYKFEATHQNLEVLQDFFVQKGYPNLEISSVPQLFGISRKGRIFLTDDSDTREEIASFLSTLYRN